MGRGGGGGPGGWGWGQSVLVENFKQTQWPQGEDTVVEKGETHKPLLKMEGKETAFFFFPRKWG